ncbi:MAG: AraC family transcriptional regulator [Rhodoferax sp.]|nr:AraC family transcriptional regulator [Rhodoferax sp.]
MSYRVFATESLELPGAEPGWVRHGLPASAGVCYGERATLGDGISLVRSYYRPERDLVEESINHSTDRTLVITLGLSGESCYLGKDGSTLRFGAGHTTLAAFRSSHGERRYTAGQTVRQLRLLVNEAALQRYMGATSAWQLVQTDGVRQLDFVRTSQASAALVRALSVKGKGGPADALDLHIAMLSLLADQLRHLLPQPHSAVRSNASDVQKLEAVRDMMASQMDRNLTLAYLCTTVGIHEFKLMQGFRQHFGTTPHRMLLELRMRRAWALLEEDGQVAQTAYQVGYAHPANFSAAFTRFFGRTPKSVFGRRSA